jgi:hypothetical protein
MRVVVAMIACGLALAACSGGTAAPSAAVPSAVLPSAVVSAPSVAPASVEPSVAVASVEPSASAAPENCMDARAHDLITKPSTDWAAISQEDREFAADALEAYDFPVFGNPDYIKNLAKALRDPSADLNRAGMQSIWAGEVTIVSCG